MNQLTMPTSIVSRLAHDLDNMILDGESYSESEKELKAPFAPVCSQLSRGLHTYSNFPSHVLPRPPLRAARTSSSSRSTLHHSDRSIFSEVSQASTHSAYSPPRSRHGRNHPYARPTSTPERSPKQLSARSELALFKGTRITRSNTIASYSPSNPSERRREPESVGIHADEPMMDMHQTSPFSPVSTKQENNFSSSSIMSIWPNESESIPNSLSLESSVYLNSQYELRLPFLSQWLDSAADYVRSEILARFPLTPVNAEEDKRYFSLNPNAPPVSFDFDNTTPANIPEEDYWPYGKSDFRVGVLEPDWTEWKWT